MKRLSIISLFILTVMALVFSGCPSPVNGVFSEDSNTQPYETRARVIVDSAGGVVFVEEDGTETPVTAVVNGVPDSPVELIDFAVLDDSSDVGRSSSSRPRIRCVVIGRRSDGRSGIWVIYRRYGVIVVPNEDGIKDSALMELVEVNGSPWLGEDWVYDAKAISDDGLVIIGQLSRPEGWKYLTGDVPEPSIGVWWSLHYSDDTLMISRARPILLMNEPVQDVSNTRCSSYSWYREWLERLIEWIQAYFLDQSWNYLADASDFVSPDEVEGGIPDGFYFVAGPDKHGVDSWAWITGRSVENIVDAPVVNPPENNPPWPVTGPTAVQEMTKDLQSFKLVVSDDSGNEIDDPSQYDPDGDAVSFTAVLSRPFTGPGADPVVTISGGGIFYVNWDPDLAGYFAYYTIISSDKEFQTVSDVEIQIYFY